MRDWLISLVIGSLIAIGIWKLLGLFGIIITYKIV